jgi:hypothetical protein
MLSYFLKYLEEDPRDLPENLPRARIKSIISDWRKR